MSLNGYGRKLLILMISVAGCVAHGQSVCDCGIGKVAAFDINMRGLPDPAEDTAELLRRQALVYLSGFFSSRAFSSGECGSIIKIDPALFLGGDTLRSGNSMNVAPDGRIKDLAYLFAGEMSVQGGAYVVNVRLEAGYSREVLKTATTSIPIISPDRANSHGALKAASETSLLVDAAGEALAAQFRPLGTLITQWEKRKRDGDPEIGRSNPDGKFELSPERTRMRKGETIHVALSLADCDGKPLNNRRIRFTGGEWNGMVMPGTTGGRIEPAVVTTDGGGKAKFRFTATLDHGTARISAWNGHTRPNGEPNAFYTEVPIEITRGSDACFTIAVDTRVGDPEETRGEEHRFRWTYRPGRIGDPSGIHAGSADCNLAAMNPGESRRFFPLELQGTARGWMEKESATSRIDKVDDTNRDAYVTVTRKARGATIEFSASSPNPTAPSPHEELINACAAQVFQPFPQMFELSEEDLQQLRTVRKVLGLTMPLGENNCVGRGTAVLTGN